MNWPFWRKRSQRQESAKPPTPDADTSGRELLVPDQFTTIQQAISAAEPGDTVTVRPGRYAECIDFLGKDITVRGTDPNNRAVVRQTVIDGEETGCVVTFQNGETAEAVLTGLSIVNGMGALAAWPPGGGISVTNQSAPTIERNVITGNASELDGGGIYVDDSWPLIRYNLIGENQAAGAGGGLHIGRDFVPSGEKEAQPPAPDTYARFLDAASPAPMRIGVTQGDAPSAGEFAMGQWLVEPEEEEKRAVVHVVGNTFVENHALSGGGLHVSDASPIIEGNSFRQNQAARGAGLALWDNSRPVVARNHFVENRATCEGGGLMIEWGSSPAIIANVVRDNQSPRGAALSVAENASPAIRGNRFASCSGNPEYLLHFWRPDRVLLADDNRFE